MSGFRRRSGARAAVVAAFVGVLMSTALSLPATTASAAGAPVKIMLVGDSITEGSTGDWTWRYRLAKYLDAAGVDYEFVGPRTTMFDQQSGAHTSVDYADPGFNQHHFARWGGTFPAVLDESAAVPDDAIGTAVTTYQPDVVVEVLGFNDLLFGSAQGTLDLAHAFLDDVRKAKPDTAVVMSSVPGEQYPRVSDYNELLTATAPGWGSESGPVVVSDPPPDWTATTDTCDHTHPSATGEVKIAAVQADALAELEIGDPAPRPLPTPAAGPRLPASLDVVRGDGQAFMTWRLPPGGDAVLISVRDVTQGEPWRQLPFAIGGNAWVSGGLTNGHTYAYKLTALKHECVASDVESNVAMATPEPAAPGSVSGLQVSPRDHGLRADWAVTNGARTYALWVKPTDTDDGWTTYPATANAAKVTGLEAGRSYDVAVQAVNDGGAGPVGASVGVTPTGIAPAAPSWRNGAGSPRGTASVSWAGARHANAYQLEYRLRRPGADWVSVPSQSERSAVVTGLRDGSRYTFRVRGVDDRLLGTWSDGLVVTVPRVGPVRDVRARALESGQVRTRGSSVPDADSYVLSSVGTSRCGHRPGRDRFTVVAKGLPGPRHAFEPVGTHAAVWVRWRAAYDGVAGSLAPSSTTCITR